MSLHDSSYPHLFSLWWLNRSAVTPAPLPNDTFRYAGLQYEPLRGIHNRSALVSFYGCRKLKRFDELKKQKSGIFLLFALEAVCSCARAAQCIPTLPNLENLTRPWAYSKRGIQCGLLPPADLSAKPCPSLGFVKLLTSNSVINKSLSLIGSHSASPANICLSLGIDSEHFR